MARRLENQAGPARQAQPLLPYVLLTPILLLVAAFVLYPMAQGVLVSLYDARDLVPRAHEYAGLANFVRLYDSPATLTTIRVTLVYVVVTTVAATVIGMASALVLNTSFRGRALFRAALTVPWGTPLVASALIWFWMFDPQYGVINYGVRLLGLSLSHLDNAPAPEEAGSQLAFPWARTSEARDAVDAEAAEVVTRAIAACLPKRLRGGFA